MVAGPPRPGYEINGHEFTSAQPADGRWTAARATWIRSGTSNWVSLTPSTNGELYFGACLTSNSGAVAGSTSGYVYIVNANNDAMAYNVSCPSGVATSPVWGGAAFHVFGIMALLKETSGGTDSGPNYATSAADLGGGPGSWVNPGNADNAPDSSYAVWTPP